MADPSVMFSQPNAGQMFAQGFQQGQERRRQNMVRGAMAELSRNPDNVKAWEVLNQADPQAAAQYKQQRIEAARAQLKDHQAQIELGAKIVRQVQPKDQAGWNQALMIAQQAGVDISQVPQQFDPNYAQQLVSLADVLAPQRDQAATEMQRNYEFLKGQDPSLAEQYLRSRAEGMPQMVTLSDGRVIAVPRAAPQGGPQPGTVEDGYRFKGGNPADKNNWEPVGGQSVAPAGNFPGPN